MANQTVGQAGAVQTVDRSPSECLLSAIAAFRQTCRDRRAIATAVRVALFIGTLLFTINHGWATANGQMTQSRWVSALLTYCVPFLVSLHGQSMARSRLQAMDNTLSVPLRTDTAQTER
ncbi:nitrate/nitrite transporter NrtS [Synechococcus elongatus]|uniref:Uncharacterized protein n=1 Tax=Synechococcus sp. (strain ATCC 27144 / PCC 6301 / SAUG 1402/1) TaxID=269084 RepID=A0A0H3K2W6_SYNP6|nr:nitrate/nitrite transporter NrtS [Synechococcus elongatus]WKW05701.1 nitrate/nitrite transporter NrtS [Synechococcus elongatus PCC 7942 = FACHB-805]BAD79575.1 hypothetical protein syc1385_c [Synechococcus elongatus PCC 6301]